jgi:mRNA-degrading endonuclease toxin of MazEF toxin-antitoxin module
VLEDQLSTRRYLVGNQLTEADIRLWPTLVRFDAVYVGHFKCNLRRLVDYPNLWAYARDLYQRPAFGKTVNFDHIKRHYYGTHDQLNPSGSYPRGRRCTGRSHMDENGWGNQQSKCRLRLHFHLNHTMGMNRSEVVSFCTSACVTRQSISSDWHAPRRRTPGFQRRAPSAHSPTFPSACLAHNDRWCVEGRYDGPISLGYRPIYDPIVVVGRRRENSGPICSFLVTSTQRGLDAEVELDRTDGVSHRCVVNLDDIAMVPYAAIRHDGRVCQLSESRMLDVSKPFTWRLPCGCRAR